MFYKFIDESTIKRAPKPLSINGKDVFTNSEEIHNENGYFRLVVIDYPQDEKTYKPIYTMKDNTIVQGWLETDVLLESDLAEIEAEIDKQYQIIESGEI